MADHIFPMVICLIVFILVAFSVIRAPKISIPQDWKYVQIDFSIAPILGVIFLLSSHTIAPVDVANGIIGNEFIKPWQIIILFFSLAYICVSMDSSGVYGYLSLKAVSASKGSGFRLFIAFFCLSAALTIFTPNDIVILTLTPLITYFCKFTNTDPLPFLFVQYFAANIFSIALYIGNPTNIIVGEAFRIPFVKYSFWMLLPAVASGMTSWCLVYLVFKSKIPNHINIPSIDPRSVLKSKISAIYGICCLFACLLLLSLSSTLKIPIWIITLTFAALMLAKDIYNDYSSISTTHQLLSNDETLPTSIQDSHSSALLEPLNNNNHDEDGSDISKAQTESNQELFNATKEQKTWKTGDTMSTLSKLPWKIVPFVVGMFIMVEGLNSTGLIGIFASGLAWKAPAPVMIFMMCFLSALVCNVLNNQPMTILFTRILLHPNFSGVLASNVQKGTMYALIMGSNFGANFTIIGALAGIMWTSILQDKGVALSYWTFAKYGFIIMPIVVSVACIILSIEISLFA